MITKRSYNKIDNVFFTKLLISINSSFPFKCFFPFISGPLTKEE